MSPSRNLLSRGTDGSNPASSSGESGTNSVIGSTQGPVTRLRIARAHLSADTARCPEAAERAYFKDLVSSYGKTFHTWQIERDNFPYGIPQLMMGFTQDGQLDEALVDARDRRLAVSGTLT